MKVLVYSARPYDKQALEAYVGNKHSLFFTDKKLSIDTVAYAEPFDAISLFTSDDASAPVLEKLIDYGVQYIALRSVGFDHVNLQVAAQLGIHVANVPEYSPYSVAEHAVALLLASNRKMIQAQKLIEVQDYRLDGLTGFDIHGKTVGVIGTGNIGLAFCKIMLGFGANVIAYDPVENEVAKGAGVNYVSFHELLECSDVISIHCPLNTATKYLFSAAEFDLMKPTATLINTSRGGIVSTKDLIIALEQGKIAAACLDVYEREKGLFFNDWRNRAINDEEFNKLRSLQNVLITGHQGFLTNEALSGIAKTTLETLDYWEKDLRASNELISREKSTAALYARK
ncbi:MAG TPA: 2-hydroxyacid dehydrogenase [Chryseosolibacter sp.]